MSFEYANYQETISVCKELHDSIERLLGSKDFEQLSRHVAEMHLISATIATELENFKIRESQLEGRIMNELKKIWLSLEKLKK